jgi:hypothetical protein
MQHFAVAEGLVRAHSTQESGANEWIGSLVDRSIRLIPASIFNRRERR